MLHDRLGLPVATDALGWTWTGIALGDLGLYALALALWRRRAAASSCE